MVVTDDSDPAGAGPPVVGATMPVWEPANPIERALAEAIAHDDRSAYFTVLRAAPLYLPAASDEPRTGRQRFATGTLAGGVCLLAFTSPAALDRAYPNDRGRLLTSYGELREKWPDPDWLLAVNPGTPIDAYVEIGAVAEAAEGRLAVPTAAELAGHISAMLATPIDPVVLAALTRGAPVPVDPDDGAAIDYVHRMLAGVVCVPTTTPVTDDAHILRDGFPWLVTGGRPAAVPVFTSAELLAAHLNDVPYLEVPLLAVVAAWPDPAYRLVLDPGSGHELMLGGDTVLRLAAHAAVAYVPPNDVG